jgi:hypothetical protein
LPAGDRSHSTDQPNGIENGQARLSVWFSQAILERQTSKTEYANTQQDLTEIDILIPELDHGGLRGSGFLFAEKQQRV